MIHASRQKKCVRVLLLLLLSNHHRNPHDDRVRVLARKDQRRRTLGGRETDAEKRRLDRHERGRLMMSWLGVKRNEVLGSARLMVRGATSPQSPLSPPSRRESALSTQDILKSGGLS